MTRRQKLIAIFVASSVVFLIAVVGAVISEVWFLGEHSLSEAGLITFLSSLTALSLAPLIKEAWKDAVTPETAKRLWERQWELL